MSSEAIPGRLLLLVSAYAPAALIVGLRAVPHTVGWLALAVGAAGLVVWTAFLFWLPHRQPREVTLADVQPVDSEVTGYIASYLLPIVAAGSPSTGDIAAYGLCAGLLLIIAFVADLGAINPVVYLFGLRVVRCSIDGTSLILLAKQPPPSGSDAMVTRALGILRVVPPRIGVNGRS